VDQNAKSRYATPHANDTKSARLTAGDVPIEAIGFAAPWYSSGSDTT
jgi:hypothetical protein